MAKVPDFKKMSEAFFRELAPKVAQEARAFFMMSFIKQGFTNNSFIAWPKRRDTETHKLLNRSMALKNSIKITSQTASRIEIEAGRGIPYADIHNNGGTITVQVTEKMRKFFWYKFKKTNDIKWKHMALSKKETWRIEMPKRQYIGNSEVLNKQIEEGVIKKMIQELQQYERTL